MLVRNATAGVDEVCPQRRPKSEKTHQRDQRKPGEGRGVDREQYVGDAAAPLEEERVRDDTGRHHQGEAARIEARDLAAEPGSRFALRHFPSVSITKRPRHHAG
jgi:hypothetical protein